jgi:hypothetical protein
MGGFVCHMSYGSYRQVRGELSAHNTAGAVGAHDLAPHDSELRALHGLGSLC